MAEKRSTQPPTRLVRHMIPVTRFNAIPASALRGLPHDGSVGDLLDALITLMAQDGWKILARQHDRRRRK